MIGFYNHFIGGQEAMRKAVDHQTHRPDVVTSVIKLNHFPTGNPRGREGRNEGKKKLEGKIETRKSSFKIHERGK